jgi:hypothetical protein
MMAGPVPKVSSTILPLCGIGKLRHSIKDSTLARCPLWNISSGNWFIQGEQGSPFMDTLPRHLDPTMLASMSLLGYKQCKIIEFSVRKTIQ